MGLATHAQAQGIASENGDQFGSTVAVGDFDGDRVQDLAVGVPGKAGGRGLVLTFRGSLRGLQPWQAIDQAELGSAASGDRFGLALVAGDFDGDGRDDLAVGAPGAAPRADRMDVPQPRAMRAARGGAAPALAGDGGAAPRAGAVFVYRGSASGLMPQQSLDQALLMGAVNRAGDDFGSALAAGDFDGDRIADLAVGAPGDAPALDGPRSGVVVVFRGTRSDGLVPARTLESELQGLAVNGEDDDFGSALAAGDFDGDRIADLAIGAPGKAVRGGLRSGSVLLFRGKLMDGLQASAALDQETGQLGANQEGDEFGSALAAADFDRDGIDDLAIGAPGDAPRDDPRAGLVYVFRGTRTGLEAAQGLEQELPGSRGALSTNARGDEFGGSLAAGDFDGDGNADLAVGVPGKNAGQTGSGPGTGIVTVFRGTSMGLLPDSRIQQGGSGGERGRSGDRFGAALAAGDFDRDGRAELAVGAPGRQAGNGARAGGVLEFAGTRGGLRAGQRLDQSGAAAADGGDEDPARVDPPDEDPAGRAPDEDPDRRERRPRRERRERGDREDAGDGRPDRGDLLRRPRLGRGRD